MPVIDYYFTTVSPFTCLGHRAFLDMAAAAGAAVRYRPMALAKVFENSGALPLAQRPKARQDYRFLELQRWRDKRGVPIHLKPKHFPTNPALADRTIIALVEAGGDPGAYMEAVCRACWVEEEDIAERAVLARLLTAAGHDCASALAAAEGERAAEVLRTNTEAAVGLEVIGSPAFVLNGEVFWGQDRIELLRDALLSGRAPYEAPR